MRLLFAFAVIAIGAVSAASPVAAQEEPPPAYTPPVVWVTAIDGGGYRVVWDAGGDAADGWEIRAAVGEPSASGGLDPQRRIDEYQLVHIPGADIWYDLPRDWTGMLAGGCTHVVFNVYAFAGTQRRNESGASVAYQICDGIDGKPVRFPALDAAPAVNPAPPAGVRLERTGTAWQLVWVPSPDAAYYDPGVLLFDKPWPADPAAMGVGSIELPLVAASERSIILPQRLSSEPAPLAGCYYALLMVFAKGASGATSILPGNVTERICTDGSAITSFPATGAGPRGDAGAGGTPRREVPAADVIAVVALAGGAVLVLGSLGTRRR